MPFSPAPNVICRRPLFSPVAMTSSPRRESISALRKGEAGVPASA